MIQTLVKHSDQYIKVLWQKIKVQLAKIELLKQFWNMILRILGVSIDGNNSIEKCE